MARTPDAVATGRGNYLFALQAMVLLEWASRLCHARGTALEQLSFALEQRNPRYFCQLPDVVDRPSEFDLPGPVGRSPGMGWLLQAIFDLVRNGQAHRYEQLSADLTGDSRFHIALTGATFGRTISSVADGITNVGPPSNHLRVDLGGDDERDVILTVRPEVLFLDLKVAIVESGVLESGASVAGFKRPQGVKAWQFDSNAIYSALSPGSN